MHPALAALSPSEARVLIDDPEALGAWLSRHSLSFRESFAIIVERAPDEEVAPVVVRSNRRDTTALLDFVDRAVRLPPRLRAVASLCLRDGVTLDAAAARLGITRETVRVHLRRLRALQRAADARRSPSSGVPGPNSW